MQYLFFTSLCSEQPFLKWISTVFGQHVTMFQQKVSTVHVSGPFCYSICHSKELPQVIYTYINFPQLHSFLFPALPEVSAVFKALSLAHSSWWTGGFTPARRSKIVFWCSPRNAKGDLLNNCQVILQDHLYSKILERRSKHTICDLIGSIVSRTSSWGFLMPDKAWNSFQVLGPAYIFHGFSWLMAFLSDVALHPTRCVADIYHSAMAL